MVRLLAAGLIAATALAAPAPISAQRGIEEIRFPRGATGVTLVGRVGSRQKLYGFRARAGQLVRIRVQSEFTAVAADLRRSDGFVVSTTDEGGRLATRLPGSGAYVIALYSQEGNQLRPYSMSLSIQ